MIWLCKRFCDFGKKERESLESHWEIRKLGDFGKERERVPGESLESIGKS